MECLTIKFADRSLIRRLIVFRCWLWRIWESGSGLEFKILESDLRVEAGGSRLVSSRGPRWIRVFIQVMGSGFRNIYFFFPL